MKFRNLGVFTLPNTATEGTATYSVPGLAPNSQIPEFCINENYSVNENNSDSDIDEDEVTHDVYFGENIKRIIKTLFK